MAFERTKLVSKTFIRPVGPDLMKRAEAMSTARGGDSGRANNEAFDELEALALKFADRMDRKTALKFAEVC